ncbi:MAG: hypothetical protein A4E39_00759 [Methanoregulaceae archaeon PtaB.Bin152]|nr:MAG: hypothetical protein A4E39_00759 [Methanoregulaceae archaeon PtaB.Bin152]
MASIGMHCRYRFIDTHAQDEERLVIKKIVHEQNNTTLDTEQDTCLFRAPRDPERGVFMRGRDLYEHPRKDLPSLYYLHRWSLVPGERESISLISPVMASRFLEQGGLFCADRGDLKRCGRLSELGIRYPERVLIYGAVPVVSVGRIAPLMDAATISPHEGAGH